MQDREEQLLNLLESYSNSLEAASSRRLTIEDLQLNPGEEKVLKSCSKDFRIALWKAGEHKCLTTFPECCRKTAVDFREYYRTMTLSLSNKVEEMDATQEDYQKEHMQQYFRKRYAHT